MALKTTPDPKQKTSIGCLRVGLNIFALVNNAVDQTKFKRFICRHEVITIQSLLDCFVILAGMSDINVVQSALHLDDVLRVTLDV